MHQGRTRSNELRDTSSQAKSERLLIKVPEITVYFWIVKLLTTAMGESTSDFLVYHINSYVAVVAGCVGLGVALIVQLNVRRYIAWVYWFAVVMVAVFGTMAADVTHIVLGVPYLISTAAFAAALVVVFLVWDRTEHTLSIHTIYPGRRELFYWATVIATFALGTAAGDMTASTLHLGYFASILLFALLFLCAAVAYRWLPVSTVGTFWFAYVMTRPLGASIADWLGKPTLGGLGIGDGLVALVLTAFIIVAVGLLAYSRVDVGGDYQRPAGT